jgi:ADP-ribosylation factor-binding protein GGA
MCEEESEDHEAVAKLFEINDSIHRTSERYKLIKKGDLEGANRIAAGTLGISGAGVKSGPNNELSLIDFGGLEDEEVVQPAQSQSSQAAPQPKGNALEDDLLGLSMGDSVYGSGGALTLGSSNNGLADLAGPSSSQQTPVPAPAAIPPPAQPQAARANYDPFGMISSPAPASNAFQKSQPQQQQKAADPFAALSGNSRTASPFQFQQSVKPPAPPAAPQSAASLLGGDDEWTFSSALPTQPQQPQSNAVTVIDSSVKAVFHISRPAGANDYLAIDARVSNKTAQPISDFTLQLAVTKVRLRLATSPFPQIHTLTARSRHFPCNSNPNPVATYHRIKSMASSKPSACRVLLLAKEMQFACDGVPATALPVNHARKAARSAIWVFFRDAALV